MSSDALLGARWISHARDESGSLLLGVATAAPEAAGVPEPSVVWLSPLWRSFRAASRPTRWTASACWHVEHVSMGWLQA